MKPDYPTASQIPGLRSLWKEAFGDTDAFLDLFFSTAYSPRRCRCIEEKGSVTAALYWFDVSCGGQKLAYIYAVATAAASRGQGLCRRLMDDTAQVLKAQDYDGILLVPQDEGLRTMYGRMGYLPATALDTFFCAADPAPVPIRELTPEEFAARRASLLPPGSVIQEGEGLSFLASLARFYEAPALLAAVSREIEHLRILEFLGPRTAAPGLVAALGHTEATLRSPGGNTLFAMYLPLNPACKKPAYFAFCFD